MASYALEGKFKESHEYFGNFVLYLADKNRTPIMEKDYYFQGTPTKRLLEGSADPMIKFVLLTLIDLLTGKLEWTEFSFQQAVAPATPPSPRLRQRLNREAENSSHSSSGMTWPSSLRRLVHYTHSG